MKKKKGQLMTQSGPRRSKLFALRSRYFDHLVADVVHLGRLHVDDNSNRFARINWQVEVFALGTRPVCRSGEAAPLRSIRSHQADDQQWQMARLSLRAIRGGLFGFAPGS